MEISIDQLATPVGVSFLAAVLLFPVLINLSPKLGLLDVPNYRKLHLMPVPVIGGLGIILSVAVAALLSHPMQLFIFKHGPATCAIVIMMLMGLFDDRFNLSIKLRLLIQLLCAFAMAYDGALINSLHGFLGIYQLPLYLQYLLTILMITAVTNAFNLMDGIDGLAGSMALINIIVLIVMSIVSNDTGWLFLFCPISVTIVVFLRYNWRPAKIFMGDSGSLVLGLIMSAAGIHFIKFAGENSPNMSAEFIVLVTSYCMIPVLDAVRVFYQRIKNGKPPFLADRTHLHHLLANHHTLHSSATNKLLKLHLSMVIISAAAASYINICWIIIGQITGVVLYVYYLRMMSSFYHLYHLVKEMELNS